MDLKRRLITAESQRREMLGDYAGFAALLGIPVAASILAAVALKLHLPLTFPAHEMIVDGSRRLAFIVVFAAYVSVTWQLAAGYFVSFYPSGLFGPSIIATLTTSVLPVACLFGGLWWAGIPIGSDANDLVARLRWLFVALPGMQAAMWGVSAAIGRFL